MAEKEEQEEFEIGFRSNRGETEFNARHALCAPEFGCQIPGENCFAKKEAEREGEEK